MSRGVRPGARPRRHPRAPAPPVRPAAPAAVAPGAALGVALPRPGSRPWRALRGDGRPPALPGTRAGGHDTPLQAQGALGLEGAERAQAAWPGSRPAGSASTARPASPPATTAASTGSRPAVLAGVSEATAIELDALERARRQHRAHHQSRRRQVVLRDVQGQAPRTADPAGPDRSGRVPAAAWPRPVARAASARITPTARRRPNSTMTASPASMSARLAGTRVGEGAAAGDARRVDRDLDEARLRHRRPRRGCDGRRSARCSAAMMASMRSAVSSTWSVSLTTTWSYSSLRASSMRGVAQPELELLGRLGRALPQTALAAPRARAARRR